MLEGGEVRTGASEALMGITVTVTCISEVPAFFSTGWVLRKLGVSRVCPITLNPKLKTLCP